MHELGPTDLLIRQAGKTRRDFAHETGLGENHLLRIGQGRMAHLSDETLMAFADVWDPDVLNDAYGHPTLTDSYDAWRLEQQKRATLPEHIPWVKGLSPAQRFAAAVGSMSKLAQVLRVNDYVVRRWVNGDTREMPEQMLEAMRIAGYPHGELINKAQQEWLEAR